MKKRTLLSLAAVLAAGAYAAVKLRGAPEAEDAPAPEEAPGEAPVDGDQTVAYPLKNKFTDYSRGEGDPTYIFELSTPQGVREIPVSWAHYETYYIGDEVICRETDHGPEAV